MAWAFALKRELETISKLPTKSQSEQDFYDLSVDVDRMNRSLTKTPDEQLKRSDAAEFVSLHLAHIVADLLKQKAAPVLPEDEPVTATFAQTAVKLNELQRRKFEISVTDMVRSLQLKTAAELVIKEM